LLSRSQKQPAGEEWQAFLFNHCYQVYRVVYLNGFYKLYLGRGRVIRGNENRGNLSLRTFGWKRALLTEIDFGKQG
jgi:hypothetical protein